MNRSYDNPQFEIVSLGTAQTAVTIPAHSAKYQALSILDASALVGATPAAVEIQIGDGTDADRFGTITIAAGGTTGAPADVTLNLTDAAFELSEVDNVSTITFTNATAPAGSVAGFNVVIGRY